MFRDIRVVLDQAGYDVDENRSLIQGWAIDPVTKSPVEVECSIPATINTMYRPDINATYGIDREVEYGFFIQFPGSVHELKPTLTFKTKEITETFGGLAFDTHFIMQPLGKLYKNLLEQGLIPKIKNPIKTLREDWKKLRGNGRVERLQPVDRFQEWFDVYEEREFTPIELIDTKHAPFFSFIVSSKGDFKNDLSATLNSIKGQLLGDYEILIATAEDLPRKTYIGGSVKLVKEENLAKAINKAAKEAVGDYLIFVDNGDTVSNHLLAEVIDDMSWNGEADFIYADSDKIDYLQDRYEPQFKPNYDEILLRSRNYILQPTIIRSELFEEVGGLREDRMGLQNYDLILRATEKADTIRHIPKILYHWRIENKHVDKDEKYLREYELGCKMLDERFKDENEVHMLSEIDYIYDLKNLKAEKNKISLITGVLEDFDNSLASETIRDILSASDYPNIEVLSANTEPIEDSRLRVFEDHESESLEELYNRLAKKAKGDILIFIAPGFHPIESAWIQELVDYLNIPEVGIVGPRFFRDTYQIVQAGVEVRDGRRYDIGRGAYCRAGGYNNSLRTPREVFAVSGNCLAIERDLFDRLEGFDTNLQESESDIDLCIRARENGKKIVAQNNVSAMVRGFDDKNGTLVKNLTKRYSPEVLDNVFINENLKTGRSALNYAPVGV